ncbi:hypothetical protein [Achromobacter phage Motura]|uniref:Uncharacterized protein n=1 Tax=Achromobacter phage Motura TaxID=2591403 RepID=A0A514CSU6_9CAUD|nr:hypothetical protein H1O15_gp245 [Achromobacter phage Motura]QDH83543.1 hypothetical protein [Achromobacter phage Motura]
MALNRYPDDFFPFTVTASEGQQPWRRVKGFEQWVQSNREVFKEKYGRQVYTSMDGRIGYHKVWSYYEADLVVTSATTAVVKFYGLGRDWDFSGDSKRGDLQEQIEITLDEFDFTEVVERKAWLYSVEVQQAREAERKRIARVRETDAILIEFFGKQL